VVLEDQLEFLLDIVDKFADLVFWSKQGTTQDVAFLLVVVCVLQVLQGLLADSYVVVHENDCGECLLKAFVADCVLGVLTHVFEFVRLGHKRP